MEIRRMFASVVAEDDMFIGMSAQTQALYFHLGMNADDFGLLRPKRVLNMLRMKEGVLRELEKGGYVITLDDGVVAITHWNVNNKMRPDKKKKSFFPKQLDDLRLAGGDTYVMSGNAAPDDERIGNATDKTRQNVTDPLQTRAQNDTDPLQMRYDSVTESCPSTVQDRTVQNTTDNSGRFAPFVQSSTGQDSGPFGEKERKEREIKERGGEKARAEWRFSSSFDRDKAGGGQYGGKKGRNPYKDDGFYHSFDPDEFFELAIRHSEKLM